METGTNKISLCRPTGEIEEIILTKTIYLKNPDGTVKDLVINKTNLVFVMACQYGDLASVINLLSVGRNDQYNYADALRWASYNGHIEIVKAILAVGWTKLTRENCDWAIQWASINGHLDVVDILMANLIPII